MPNTHLVMHGSSSVPQEWLAIIREHGGDIKETYGVPVEEIQRGIKHGVRKINIDTDIRLAMTGAMRHPRKALIAAKKAARVLCKAALRGLRLRGPGRAHCADRARGHGQALPLRPSPAAV
jgi:fructose-bisphosphate aldolase class II